MCEGGGGRIRNRASLRADQVDVPGRAETRLADEILDAPELERLADDTGACRAAEKLSPLFHRNLDRPSGVAQAPWCAHRAEVAPGRVRRLDGPLMGKVPFEA
jgi:hypothetical protein